jgi:hypothetical protein
VGLLTLGSCSDDRLDPVRSLVMLGIRDAAYAATERLINE